MSNIHKKNTYKDWDYPWLLKFRDAITESRWFAEEFDFHDDIQDYRVRLTKPERTVAKRAMLAISQVEVETIKEYWSDINKIYPKHEIAFVGKTFAENEIVHSESYALLLEKLGLNNEFEELLKNPVIAGRVNYLTKYLKQSGENKHQFEALKLILFTLFVENVSLFSQFAILKSFRRHKNYLKSIDNVVLSTQKDEAVHAKFGVELIKIIKKENPDWFNNEFYSKIYEACAKAFEAEAGIIEWIFEEGDLDFIKKSEVIEFIKYRFNSSLEEIGGESLFSVNEDELKNLNWFIEEIYLYTRNDFFNTKSANYNKVVVSSGDIIDAVRRIVDEVV